MTMQYVRFNGANPVQDPYWSDVILMVHGEGADASTSFPDSSLSNRTPTATGNVQVDTAQFKAGAASILFDGAGDYLSYAGASSTPADFTIELFFRENSLTADQGLVSLPASNWNLWLIGSTKKVELHEAGALRIGSSVATSTGVWYHLAWTRASGVMRAFLDGTQFGGTYSDSAAIEIGAPRFGTPNAVGNYFDGWLDEIRITRNVARYTANFTVPSVPFPDM